VTPRAAMPAAVVLVAAAAVAGCGAPSPAPSASRAPAPAAVRASSVAVGVPQRATITFYAAADNDPPGSTDIAHPSADRPAAGGTGSYDDPLTLATDARELRPGARIYYPPLRRYFVMEDDCAECIDDWDRDHTPHLDLWVADTRDPAVDACEAALTPDDPVEFLANPPPGLPVDPRPLWDQGRCFPDTAR
jgi:hypothetical protein